MGFIFDVNPDVSRLGGYVATFAAVPDNPA